MNQFKRAQVIMLPTEYSNINLYNNMRLIYSKDHSGSSKLNCQHLYIISDDEIKGNDWYVNILYNEIRKCNNKDKYQTELYINNSLEKIRNKKIIATTDTSLLMEDSNKNAGFTVYNLPQPSQQFIEKFIEFYNKGEVITEVLVEYNLFGNGYPIGTERYISNSVLKINPKDNTITIKKLKDNWNREELDFILNSIVNDLCCKSIKKPYNSNECAEFTSRWIEKNL